MKYIRKKTDPLSEPIAIYIQNGADPYKDPLVQLLLWDKLRLVLERHNIPLDDWRGPEFNYSILPPDRMVRVRHGLGRINPFFILAVVLAFEHYKVGFSIGSGKRGRPKWRGLLNYKQIKEIAVKVISQSPKPTPKSEAEIIRTLCTKKGSSLHRVNPKKAYETWRNFKKQKPFGKETYAEIWELPKSESHRRTKQKLF